MSSAQEAEVTFPVLSKEVLADNIKKIQILAPDIAKKAKAGQFIIVQVTDKGERVPLTVCQSDRKTGSITIVVQEIGKTTCLLGSLKPGDHIKNVLGPLGHPTNQVNNSTIIAIGGGVGVAEILPVSKMYREAGNNVIGIIGARNKDLVILEKEMAAACTRLIVTTDDGSYSRKGFVTEVLKELLEQGTKPDIVYAIGPVPMMQAVSSVTKPFAIKTIVSLNPIMVDGTGMCGACRVTVGGETKFACVDGPEFDAHAVLWDELKQRLSVFTQKEKMVLEQYKRQCSCNNQGS
jgi:NAD(P)H-flavin reductase